MMFIVALSGCSSHQAQSRKGLNLFETASSSSKGDNTTYCLIGADGIYGCPSLTSLNSVNIIVLESDKASAPKIPDTEVVTVDQAVAVNFANVLFGFDRADLSDLAQSQLSTYVPLLQGKYIVVNGHTDAIGDQAYNDGLAQQRASAVKNFLVSKGLSASLIDAQGKGACCYLAPNDSEKSRSLNRRVEISTR